MKIPFNKAFIAGRELYHIAEAISNGELKGGGPYGERCQEWIKQRFGIGKVLLTSSGTGALEMAATLAKISPAEEVILPSFTFTSTANAFVLRGARPVFVDIREDTLNIDERLIESAVGPKTKVICPVHYAGVGCEMDAISAVASKHDLTVVEDAAHAIMSTYKGRPLGSIAPLAIYSFHETKNYSAGEGGALLINDPGYFERAEILWEKGTNRAKFFRGEVDKYTWVDIGGSYVPSEIIAAFLYGQLERADEINSRRLKIWSRYYDALEPFEAAGLMRRPVIPVETVHNAHMFYIVLDSPDTRAALVAHMKKQGISLVSHYVPLHLSPMGRSFGGREGQLPVTERIADSMLRLPLFCDLTEAMQDSVISGMAQFFLGRAAHGSKMAANE